MRITTLGALAVDGQPVRGDRLATVIRALVGARGRTVSTAALTDAVWQGAPPEDATGAVQALVSRVRRLGVPVLSGPGGYRVPPEDVQVDEVTARSLVDRGQAALAAGDAAAARRDADEARALFPEIPELGDAGPARLFAGVAALRAEAALAGQGGFDEADLRRLTARVPPDEPSTALLVRVLAAQGRDAEALDVVDRVRSELADRYGADPSPVLAGVHLALLRGELAERPRPVPKPGLPAAWRRAATALVGRDDDLAAVTLALTVAPLVTVVATGGAGKTRLAAEISRRAAGPVRVVELAGLRASAEVLPAVLTVLGGGDTAATGLPLERRVLSPEERLRAVAADLDGLLVLDNCEHLLDAAAAVVADLLAVASPEVTVLATSRAPLGLVGEVVHRLTALPDAEALALLESRARAGGAATGWDPAQSVALCHRLDNLPLALELAAARLRHMPIGDVLAGLTDRFALLDDALRGLPERHASLWAMVDWSRELLGPADRELLERLAVIPAPFSGELARAVAGGKDVRRGLAALVEQSLLRLDEGDGGAARYRMLETVREYGEARLAAAGTRDEAMAGLTGWARDRAATLAAGYVGPGQIEAYENCAADQDNLLAALRRSVADRDEPAVADIAPALFQLWTVRGLHLEVSAWGRQVLLADDPVARTGSAIAHGRATGRPQPDADRLTTMCMLIAVNAGITGPLRLNVLARRALRVLLAERPGQISERNRALAGVLPRLEMIETEVSVRLLETLIAHDDPYVRAMGFLGRSALRENGGQAEPAVSDGELAYRDFERAGDHWGMGMAAQSIGHSVSFLTDQQAGLWLLRSEQHLEVIGAVQEARSIRVTLDARLALGGDAGAEGRLLEIIRTPEPEEMDAAQANLGLAQLALQRARYGDALAYAEAVAAGLTQAAGPGPGPQPRIIFRVAVAVIHLRVAEARAEPADARRADERASTVLRLARADVLTAHDSPLLGAWALGGAELAAFRGDAALTRELWSLGMRIGANVSRVFPQGQGERLAAHLGPEADRGPLLAVTHAMTTTAVNTRIRELMDHLLG